MKIKEYIDKVISKQNKTNYIILGILIIVFLVSSLIYSLITFNLSDIEKNKIIDDTTPYINYLENIENTKSKDIDKYIIYTLEYYKYEKSEDSIKTEEIKNFIYDTFDIKLNTEEIRAYGVSSSMLEKNIVYNVESDTYSIILNNRSLKELEEIPVVYYKREKISIYNKKKYKVKYKKYIIDNPLELLNKVLEYNTGIDKVEDQVNISDLREYLQTGDLRLIKQFLNQNGHVLKKYYNSKKTVKVTYQVNNDKLTIVKIK